jgi:CHAD domain-containing protein
VASRRYRIGRDERIPDGIARIAQGRIGHAIDQLRGSTKSSPEEAVHEARKDMKKLRALLRLVRGEVGDETYRHENAHFRAAARELAGVRDADVMLATLDDLEERFPQDLPADAAGGLRQALEAHKSTAATDARAEAASVVVELLREARGRVAQWPLERDGFEAVHDGLRRIYRQGRRDWRAAHANPTPEAFHEWRKRVKDLWYHCLILEEAWEPVMTALADEAHELADRLGDDHDLAVLLAWALEHATALDGMERVRAFEEVVQRRREQLQAEAFVLGERLYADTPGVFVERIERWWRASAAAVPEEARTGG